MKIVASVQARMNSTRLPGKSLLEISTKPILWHVIHQIKGSKLIDDIIIATTKNKEDDAIENFAREHSFNVYRGREYDLLDRLFRAGKQCNADVIIRIWGDCPLIDPQIIDDVLKKFINGKYEYANNFKPHTYPFGITFEIYTSDLLEHIWYEADKMVYRRFPFEYMYDNENDFKTLYEQNDIDLSHIKLTVDYIEDLNMIKQIFLQLFDEKNIISMNQVLDFLKKHPELQSMNKQLKRNIEYNKRKQVMQ